MVTLDVPCCYLWLFSLYIKIKNRQKQLLNVRLADDHLYGIAIHLAVAGDVYDGVFLLLSVSHEMSWVRSWT